MTIKTQSIAVGLKKLGLSMGEYLAARQRIIELGLEGSTVGLKQRAFGYSIGYREGQVRVAKETVKEIRDELIELVSQPNEKWWAGFVIGLSSGGIVVMVLGWLIHHFLRG